MDYALEVLLEEPRQNLLEIWEHYKNNAMAYASIFHQFTFHTDIHLKILTFHFKSCEDIDSSAPEWGDYAVEAKKAYDNKWYKIQGKLTPEQEKEKKDDYADFIETHKKAVDHMRKGLKTYSEYAGLYAEAYHSEKECDAFLSKLSEIDVRIKSILKNKSTSSL